jgi:hypothetical protein
VEAIVNDERGVAGRSAVAAAVAAVAVAAVVGLLFELVVGSPRSLAVFIGLGAGVCTASIPWTLRPPGTVQARLWTGLATFVIAGAALVGVSGVDMASPGSMSVLILVVGFAGFMSGFAAGHAVRTRDLPERS